MTKLIGLLSTYCIFIRNPARLDDRLICASTNTRESAGATIGKSFLLSLLRPPNNWMDKRGPWVGGWMIQSMTSKKCENNLLTLVKTAKSSHKRLSEPISPQKTRSAKCTHEASSGCVFLSTLYHTNLLIIIQSTHWLYILLPDTC